jgi:hypothetical protein
MTVRTRGHLGLLVIMLSWLFLARFWPRSIVWLPLMLASLFVALFAYRSILKWPKCGVRFGAHKMPAEWIPRRCWNCDVDMSGFELAHLTAPLPSK